MCKTLTKSHKSITQSIKSNKRNVSKTTTDDFEWLRKGQTQTTESIRSRDNTSNVKDSQRKLMENHQLEII